MTSILETARQVVEFRPIPGFEDYGVSRDGEIQRITPRAPRAAGRSPTLKQARNQKGYLYVNVRAGGVSRHLTVHRAVALAWIPNPNSMPLVAHLDGTKDNNAIDNLVWANAAENAFHMIAHGTRKYGSDVNKSKLTDEQVLAIRQKYHPKNYPTGQLADEYGVDQSHLCGILKGHTWRHVGGPVYERLDVFHALSRTASTTYDAIRKQLKGDANGE